jgi:MSHA biogenesis protein MshM
MRQYLDFRLTHSGYNGPSLISDRTLKRLHRLSGGVPRMINVLTHKALLSAFADKRFQLSPGDVDRAWRDSRPRINSRRPWLAPVLAGAAVSLLAMITVWSLL